MIAAKKKAVEDLDKLGDETYLEVATAAFDHRTIEVQRTISKRLGKKFFRNASKSDWKGVSNAKESLECPDQHSDSKPGTSNKSALKSPFIYRGDKIPEDGVLTFDVEKLVLKMKKETGKHENAASSVAVVNEDKELVMWSLVKWDNGMICRIPTGLTGLSLEKLKIGQSIETVSHFIKLCFVNNTIVGYDPKNDLKCLGMEKEEVKDLNGKLEDLCKYFVDAKNQPYSLKDVCEHFFPDDQFQCGIHSAIQDARKTCDLYVKKKELCELYPNFIDYPGKILRSPKEYDPRNNGICTCKPNLIHPNQMQPKKKKFKKGNKYYVPG